MNRFYVVYDIEDVTFESGPYWTRQEAEIYKQRVEEYDNIKNVKIQER